MDSDRTDRIRTQHLMALIYLRVPEIRVTKDKYTIVINDVPRDRSTLIRRCGNGWRCVTWDSKSADIRHFMTATEAEKILEDLWASHELENEMFGGAGYVLTEDDKRMLDDVRNSSD